MFRFFSPKNCQKLLSFKLAHGEDQLISAKMPALNMSIIQIRSTLAISVNRTINLAKKKTAFPSENPGSTACGSLSRSLAAPCALVELLRVFPLAF